MITLFVMYEGDADARFDKDYYTAQHIPKVEEVWRPYGMTSASALFPADSSRRVVCVCACLFEDEDGIAKALADPRTRSLMKDVKHFTDITPTQVVGRPVS